MDVLQIFCKFIAPFIYIYDETLLIKKTIFLFSKRLNTIAISFKKAIHFLHKDYILKTPKDRLGVFESSIFLFTLSKSSMVIWPSCSLKSFVFFSTDFPFVQEFYLLFQERISRRIKQKVYSLNRKNHMLILRYIPSS